LNATNDLVIIPNSVLAKTRLINLSSPDEAHGISILARLVPTHNPAFFEEMMRTVLLASNSLLQSPAPLATITRLDNQAIEFELTGRVRGASRTISAKNELYDLVYRHAHAAGVPIAAPKGVAGDGADAFAGQTRNGMSPERRLLDSMNLFATLTDDEKEKLTAKMTRHAFHKDAVIVSQGTIVGSLMLLRRGVVLVSRTTGASEVELSRLSPGDCFGERGVLIDAAEPG
jgi:hypothetical protein